MPSPRARPRDERRAGVLLHPTSLPAKYGCGDIGPSAHRFLEFLSSAGQSLWQMLPITPPGRGFSPYDSTSSFAGSPWLISPEALVAEGLLGPSESNRARLPPGIVDPPRMMASKRRALTEAHRRAMTGTAAVRGSVLAFARREAAWLDDFAMHEALVEATGRPWPDWPAALRDRKPEELARVRRELKGPIEQRFFEQWAFARQWQALRTAARRSGVHLVGDLPMFLTLHSADVWANRTAFDLDGRGRPRAVSGVPPDRFSARGQCWDTPVFAWRRLQRAGFDYWLRRARAASRRFDTVRLDHFIGLARYWRIAPGGDARRGRFVPVPGHQLLGAIAADLGELPFIVEDLGAVTPEVVELRNRHELMGMGVLPFGWADPKSEHAPHHVTPRTVYYTSLHDTDTALGEFLSEPARRRRLACETLGIDRHAPVHETCRGLLRTAYRTRANWVIVPVQDVLGLDSSARMNVPGTSEGNWRWRLDTVPRRRAATQLAALVRHYDRDRALRPDPQLL